MPQPLEYIQGSDLPDSAITWLDNSGQPIDFSSGYTFEARIGNPGQAALVTKTTGILGASTTPNITITWANTGELNTLTPGSYDLDLRATRTADSKQRIRRLAINVLPAIV